MMEGLAEIIAGVLIIIGALFALMGSIGLLRLQDVYSRMHAASKAGTVGSGLMMIALAVVSADSGTAIRALAGVFFFVLTAPIAAHLLARAAYMTGYQLWEGSIADEMAAKKPKGKTAKAKAKKPRSKSDKA